MEPAAPPTDVVLRPALRDDALCLSVLAMQVFPETCTPGWQSRSFGVLSETSIARCAVVHDPIHPAHPKKP
jgi:hypothetical protein